MRGATLGALLAFGSPAARAGPQPPPVRASGPEIGSERTSEPASEPEAAGTPQSSSSGDRRGDADQTPSQRAANAADAAVVTPAERIFDPLDPFRATLDWRAGRPRWFVSGTFDAGFLYLRPRFSAGYGLPHYAWAGFDANPLVSGEGAGGYLGVRGSLPAVDLRIGARYFHTFDRSFLCPTEGYRQPDRCETIPPVEYYDRDDLESRVGPKSVYLTLEAELTFDVRLGPGWVTSELALSAVTGVPDDYFVFEETIKLVAEPPFIWRARVGYEFIIDPARTMRVGVATEIVGSAGRDTYTLRGGVVGRVWLYANLEARGIFIPVLASRDSLGASGGDIFLLGLRYRWSTE